MKLEIPCLSQLSSQGSRNDLNASTDPKDATTMLMKSSVVRSTEVDGALSPPKPLDPNGRSVNANESVHYHHCSNGYSCHGCVEPVTILDLGVTSANPVVRSTELDGALSPPKPLDPNGRYANANESVHYHHCSNGYSCHGRVEPVTISDLGVTSAERECSL